MLSITIYNFGYAQELIQTDFEGVLIWSKFQYFGISFIPGFILLLTIKTYKFSQQESFNRLIYLIFIPAFVILITQITYPYNLKFYNDFDVEFYEGYHVLLIDRGMFYWTHITQVILGLAMSLYLYIKILLKKSSTVSRNSIVLLLVGISIPTLSFVQYVFFPDMSIYDPIPLSMALATPFYSYGILSSHLVSDSNIAKIKLFNYTDNAVFVFDINSILIDINSAAINYFDLDSSEILYTKIEDFQFTEDIEVIRLGEKFGEIVYRDKTFKLSSLNFNNSRGRIRGTIWTLSDISEEKKQLNTMLEREAKDNPLGIYDRNYWLRKGSNIFNHTLRSGGNIQLTFIQIDESTRFIEQFGLEGYYSLFKEIIKRVKVICGDQVEMGLYNDETIALLFYDQSLTYLQVFIEKCIKVMRLSPFFLDDNVVNCNISIGAYAPDNTVLQDLEEYIVEVKSSLELVLNDQTLDYYIKTE